MRQSEFSFDHISRRQALKILGGGATLAVLAGCKPFGGSNTKVVTPGGGKAFTSPTEIASENGLLTVDLVAAESMLPWNDGHRFALTYNGTVHGPTLRARPGDIVTVNFTNNLSDPTNLHTHGLHVSPEGSSDNVFRMISTGDTQTYQYEIPQDHPSGTFWYHPHHHGNSAAQLSGGLSGVFIIEDAIDDTAEIKAMAERVIVLSDPKIGTSKNILSISSSEQMAGREGDVVLVNGLYQPKMSGVQGTTEHWRIVNTSTSRYHMLTITGAEFNQISHGQERYAAPVTVQQILLTPGQRAEILVTIGATEISLEDTTYNRGAAMGGMGSGMSGGMGNMGGMGSGMKNSSFSEETVTLLTVDVQKSNKTAAALPSVIHPTPTSNNAQVDKTRAVAFGAMSMGKGEFVINGKSFNHDRIDYKTALGTTEEWVIHNGSMMDHPFHLHVWPFQVVSSSDGTQIDDGWRDTVNIPVGESVTIRIPFKDFAGTTVYHCHILDHEDLGMMATINVQ